MIRIIRSTPDSCVNCGSENIGSRLVLMQEEGNTVFCNHCGIVMVIQEEYDDDEPEEDRLHGRAGNPEVGASFLVCPHCKTANKISVAGGEEWCESCGLDPNRDDYPADELSHLWREGSRIRNAMEEGKLRRGTRMFEFLVNFCGPHCNYSEDCPQTARNFAVCYREECLDFHERTQFSQMTGDVVGRKSRKGRKTRRRERKRLQKAKQLAAQAGADVAVLECASSGWYERNLKHRDETPNPQESAHTGSGSGT